MSLQRSAFDQRQQAIAQIDEQLAAEQARLNAFELVVAALKADAARASDNQAKFLFNRLVEAMEGESEQVRSKVSTLKSRQDVLRQHQTAASKSRTAALRHGSAESE